jgi:hypothetical protein
LLQGSAPADERVGQALGFEGHEQEQVAKGSSGGARLGDLVGPEEVSQAPVAQSNQAGNQPVASVVSANASSSGTARSLRWPRSGPYG